MHAGTCREKTEGLDCKCINLTRQRIQDQPWRGNAARPDRYGDVTHIKHGDTDKRLTETGNILDTKRELCKKDPRTGNINN